MRKYCLVGVLFWVFSFGATDAQVPGFLGRTTIANFYGFGMMANTNRYRNHSNPDRTSEFFLNHSEMVSIEKVIARHRSSGISLETLGLWSGDARFYEDYDYREGNWRTRAYGIGLFFKKFLFQGTNVLAPMGTYSRFDVQVYGASTKFTSNDSTYQDTLVARFIYPAVSLSIGTNLLIKGRVILDLGMRLKASGLLGFNLYKDPEFERYRKANFGLLGKADLFKLYAGLGFLF